MAEKIPQEIIDEILSRISLESLIGEFTPVSGSGGSAMAVCPFHDDKTPSLSINDEQSPSTWYCHTCDVGGTAKEFLAKIRGIELQTHFREIMLELAERAGVDVSTYFAPPRSSASMPSRDSSHPGESKKQFFLKKLIENMKTIRGSHAVVLTRAKNAKGDGEDDGPEKGKHPVRISYYPGVDYLTGKVLPGSPGEKLNISKIVNQAKQNERSVDFGVSLFSSDVQCVKKDKNSKGYYRLHKTQGNETHLLMVSLDFDNIEWKSARGNKEYQNLERRDGFIAETKERLYTRLKESLERLELWEYAAVVDSGTGFHVHFILNEIEEYSKIDMVSEAGVFDCGQFYEYVVKTLSMICRSDPSLTKRTSMVKIFPGTPYTKITPHRSVEARKDARGFLTLRQIYERFPKKIPFAELEKDFTIYNKSFGLFQPHGRLPDNEFLQALGNLYKTKPTPQNIEADFKVYIEGGVLPGVESEETETYKGAEDWEGGDGSAIRISKNYGMFYRKKKKKYDNEGNEVWEDEWIRIPCGYALIPRYVIVEDQSKPDEFKIVFDAIRPGEKRQITIDGHKFGCADSLQKAMVTLRIDITLAQASRAALYSYAIKHAKPITPVFSGVSWDSENSPIISGYDWVYRDGKIFRGKEGIVDTDNGTLYIKGHKLRDVNVPAGSSRYASKSPEPGGKAAELRDKIDQLFVSPEVSRLFLSFLAASMLREKIIEETKGMPLLTLHGETGCGKTTLLEVAKSIFNQELLTNRPTISTTIKSQKYRKNGVLLFDELDKEYLPHLVSWLKDCVTNSNRPRQNKDGGIIADDRTLNTSIIGTNEPIHFYGDAWDYRMLKIKFDKLKRRTNTAGLSEVHHYAERNGFDLYIELFEKAAAVNMETLFDDIRSLEKTIAVRIGKDLRLARYYASVIAIGFAVGIIEGTHYDTMIDFIASNEGERGTDTSIIQSNLLECALDMTKGNPEIDLGREYDARYPGGEIIPQVMWISLERFTKFLKNRNVFHNIDQRTVSQMINGLGWIEKNNTSKTQFINGEKKLEHCTHLIVNFGNEVFKNDLYQNIEKDHKKWCRLRSSPDE